MKVDNTGALWGLFPVFACDVYLIRVDIVQDLHMARKGIHHVFLLPARVFVVGDNLRVNYVCPFIRSEAVYTPVEFVPLPRHMQILPHQRGYIIQDDAIQIQMEYWTVEYR